MEDFDTFWKAYPRKIAKGAARAEWLKLKKKKILPQLEYLIAAVDAQTAAYKSRPTFQKDGWQFFPHCRTWLHQERWADIVEAPDKQKVGDFWDGLQ